MTVQVGGETAIQATFDAISIAGLLNSKNGEIFGNFGTHSTGPITAFTTTLGISAQALQAELQGAVDAFMTELNANLTTGIKIPTVFGINASDVELNMSQGFLEFGINVTPATFLDLQDTWVSYKKHVDSIRAGAFKTQKYTALEPTLFLQ